MARQRVQQLQIGDFTGGLNYRDDSFAIPINETPDCLNVRISNDGFRARKSFKYLNSTQLSNNPKNIWPFYGNGVTQIVVQDGNDAAYSTGGNFTSINPDALTLSGTMRAASMARVGTASSERLYVQRNAEQVAWKWSGSAATVLADASAGYNATIGTPAGGRMPLARYITAHAGFMFHGYTVEGGATYKTRVRWSHPGEPEDYRSTDYIDVGADDGDVVTGLASMGDQLYIFKARSVWVFTGYDATTFQLQKVVDGIGAVSQEAIAIGRGSVYFFDGSKGAFELQPNVRGSGPHSVNWLWEKLYTVLLDHTIPVAATTNAMMGWMDNRLWLSVPWEGSNLNARVFVFDPQVGKQGAWYAYEYANVLLVALGEVAMPLGPFLEWHPTATASLFLACSQRTYDTANGSGTVYQLDFDESANDIYASSGFFPSSSFLSHFRTAWYNAGIPAVKKRWRRPTYIMEADDTSTVSLGVFTDWAPTDMKRSQQLAVSNAGGSGTLWGAANWNAFTWGENVSSEEQLIRGTAYGNAYAVQLEFNGEALQNWGVHGLDLRYIPQRIR